MEGDDNGGRGFFSQYEDPYENQFRHETVEGVPDTWQSFLTAWTRWDWAEIMFTGIFWLSVIGLVLSLAALIGLTITFTVVMGVS